MKCNDAKNEVKSTVFYKSSSGWVKKWRGLPSPMPKCVAMVSMEASVDLVGSASLACENEDAELCLVASSERVSCVEKKKKKKTLPKPLWKQQSVSTSNEQKGGKSEDNVHLSCIPKVAPIACSRAIPIVFVRKCANCV